MNHTTEISACKCNCLILETRVCSHTISLSPKLKLCFYMVSLQPVHGCYTLSLLHLYIITLNGKETVIDP